MSILELAQRAGVVPSPEMVPNREPQPHDPCFICGRSGRAVSMDLHHIDGDRTNNSNTNLVTLCTSCHQRIHNSNRPEYQEWRDKCSHKSVRISLDQSLLERFMDSQPDFLDTKAILAGELEQYMEDKLGNT